MSVEFLRMIIRLGLFGYLNQVGLVTCCAKFQLSSCSRSGFVSGGGVVWGGFQMATGSNSNASCF